MYSYHCYFVGSIFSEKCCCFHFQIRLFILVTTGAVNFKCWMQTNICTKKAFVIFGHSLLLRHLWHLPESYDSTMIRWTHPGLPSRHIWYIHFHEDFRCELFVLEEAVCRICSPTAWILKTRSCCWRQIFQEFRGVGFPAMWTPKVRCHLGWLGCHLLETRETCQAPPHATRFLLTTWPALVLDSRFLNE